MFLPAVWYNTRRMLRRSLALAILALVVLPLTGGIAFAPVCFDPCPEETGETSCPPVCLACTHAAAVMQHAPAGLPLFARTALAAELTVSPSLLFPDDILHVPLFG